MWRLLSWAIVALWLTVMAWAIGGAVAGTAAAHHCLLHGYGSSSTTWDYTWDYEGYCIGVVAGNTVVIPLGEL